GGWGDGGLAGKGVLQRREVAGGVGGVGRVVGTGRVGGGTGAGGLVAVGPVGRSSVAQDPGELAGRQPLELPLLRAGAVEDGDLEVGRGDVAGRRRPLTLAEGLHGE